MRLTKRQARYIWYCIGEHGGYAENRDEWLENCGISDGVNTGYAYTVTGFNPTTDEDGDPCVMVVCKTESDRRVDVPSNCLTHERPQIDSWELLEEDATIAPAAYCHDRGLTCACDPDPDAATYVEAMTRDLVRRARALAGDA